MKLIDRLLGRKPEAKATDTLDLFRTVFGSTAVKSGQTVNYSTALEVTAVLACARVIAEAIATVPLKIMRVDGDRRVEATDHPLSPLFDAATSEFQNSVEFREQIGLHLALVRNAYVFVNRVRGKIVELIPFEPQTVTVKRYPDRSLLYKVTPIGGGAPEEFGPDDIWHIRAFPNWSGWLAAEVVKLAREAVGLAMATEEAHAKLHANGAQTSGVYTINGVVNEEQHKKLRKWLEEYVEGTANKSRVLILDRDGKFQQMQMTGVDAQHLETRRFQIEEIARAMGVQPIMIGYSDKAATYASAEQMFLAHAVHTARPWHRRIEASIYSSLLTKRDREEGIYPKFVDAELLRGAAAARSDYYGKGIKDGWLTRNEARRFEDLNPLPGLDVPLMPLNMSDGSDPPSANDPADPAPSDPPSNDDPPQA